MIMTKGIQEKLKLRLDLSAEKADMARVMLEAGRYNESVMFSYLSLFYSIRLLLIDREDDSDDPEKILSLAESFFEPSGWNGVDILSIFRESKRARDRIENEPGHSADPEMARNFYVKAVEARSTILKKTGHTP
ncbi:MAG TPA: hypothetical protein ENN21_11545 [Spirochaetes bacterium]|nr:hypothetical protein [Spirochaetota bacterium]